MDCKVQTSSFPAAFSRQFKFARQKRAKLPIDPGPDLVALAAVPMLGDIKTAKSELKKATIPHLANMFNLLTSDGSVTACQKFAPNFPRDPYDTKGLLATTPLEARKFYRNFWNLNIKEREKFFADAITIYHPLAFSEFFASEECKSLIDRFLPPPEPEREKQWPGITAYRNGWFFIKVLFEHLQEHDKDHVMTVRILNALLFALHDQEHMAKPDDTKEAAHIKFGHRLKNFLVEIGGAKIAQAAHSYVQTPDEWSEGLGLAKSDVNRLSEEEFKTLAKQVLPPEIFDRIIIGENMGTGTYMDTRVISGYSHPKATKAGTEFVLQLLKPDAAERSKSALQLMLDVFAAVAKKDQASKDSVEGFLPVVEHVRDMVDEEVRLEGMAPKAETFEKLYNDTVVKYSDLTVKFTGPGIYDHGKGYRISRNIKGVHFSKLPEGKLKERIAFAILLVELHNIFSGRCFDHDRHGDNQGITVSADGKEVLVANFDDYATTTVPPTDKQKRIFANILMDGIANSAVNGFRLDSSLKHTFSKVSSQSAELLGADNKSDMRYVNSMIKAVMALEDYMDYLSKPLIAVLLSKLQNAGLDKTMLEHLATRQKAIVLRNRYGDEGEPSSLKVDDLRLLRLERERRTKFYPAPPPEKKRFAKGYNKRLTPILLLLGDNLLKIASLARVDLQR